MINIVKHIVFLTIFVLVSGGLLDRSSPYLYLNNTVNDSKTVEMNTNEIWKPIKGYEGLYDASNYGRVKSLNRAIKVGNKIKHISGKLLYQSTTQRGYKIVHLYKNNNDVTFLVHRLVGTTFINNPQDKPQINHKNGLKWDNYIDNLEWNTASENITHGYKTGLQFNNKGGDDKRSFKVQMIDAKTNVIINTFNSYGDAQRFTGVGTGNISLVCNNKRITAGGYKWKRIKI